MITPIDAAKELLRRRKARSNLQDYIVYTTKGYKTSAFSTEVCGALDRFLDDVFAGKRPILILQAPPQHGKQIADETPVLTNNGWKTHGTLLVGDFVYAPNGKPVEILALSDKTPSNVKVTLTDGNVIYCHERHEWTVYSRDKKRYLTLETRDMLTIGARSARTNPLMCSGTKDSRGSRFNYQLPKITPLKGRTLRLPVAPYSLGAWLGDGTRIAPRISGDAKDVAIVEGIVADGYPLMSQWSHSGTGVVTTSFQKLWKDLKRANVTSTTKNSVPKHIPDIYFTASVAQRLELLAGLIDTDGYVYQKNGRVVFTTSEKELADSLVSLISTFGWRATVVKEKPKLSSSGIQGKRDYWVVGFNPDRKIPCRLERKATLKLTKPRKIAIANIEFGDWGKIGNCVQVDSDDGLYLVGKTLIPTHNSEMVSRKLPAYIMGKYHDLRIMAASYANTLASTMSQDVRRNLASDKHQKLFPIPDTKFKYSVNRAGEFTSPYGGEGSYLGDGVGGGFTGRPGDIFIIDDPIKNAEEALSPTTKESHWNWYQSTMTTRLSENSGQIIMATSWAEDDLSGRIAAEFEGDPRLTVLRYPAINSIDEAGYRPDLPEGPLVPGLKSLEFLKEIKKLLSDYWFAAMYQQSPKALGGNVFKEAGIRYYLPKDLPEKFDKVIASWDCTFKDTDGTDFVVGQVWGKRAADSYLLDQVRARMSFTRTVMEVQALNNKWPMIRETLIEDKANGPAVIDTLRATIPGIIAIEPDGSKLARAHAVTSYWEAGNVYIPDPSLTPWVKAYVAEMTGFPAAANDDQVDSTTQALRRLYPLFKGLNVSEKALANASR